MVEGVGRLAEALSMVIGEGPTTGQAEKELLAAVSRCLCTVLHAARRASPVDSSSYGGRTSSLALRLTCAIDELLQQCTHRGLATEVSLPSRTSHSALLSPHQPHQPNLLPGDARLIVGAA